MEKKSGNKQTLFVMITSAVVVFLLFVFKNFNGASGIFLLFFVIGVVIFGGAFIFSLIAYTLSRWKA